MNIPQIKSEQEYTQALNEAEKLWGAQTDTFDGDKLDTLITIIEIYESVHYPIDSP